MKILLALMLTVSFSAVADPSFPELSRKEQKDIGNEFGANFAHTTVNGPETDGAWGLELGVLASQTNSPQLSRVIERENGNGEDYKHLYGAGVLARIHFPLDLFIEGSYLPNQEFDDININSHSYSAGWNFGGFFDWGLDIAVGASLSRANFKFNQEIQNSSTLFVPVDGTVRMNATTKVYYVAVSKSLGIFTPYVKYGVAHNDVDTKVNAASGDVFSYSANQEENIKTEGSYFVAGSTIDLLIFKLGGEYTKMLGVERVSAKVSLDF